MGDIIFLQVTLLLEERDNPKCTVGSLSTWFEEVVQEILMIVNDKFDKLLVKFGGLLFEEAPILYISTRGMPRKPLNSHWVNLNVEACKIDICMYVYIYESLFIYICNILLYYHNIYIHDYTYIICIHDNLLECMYMYLRTVYAHIHCTQKTP